MAPSPELFHRGILVWGPLKEFNPDEMASPQKENGYIPIANEIAEALMRINLNGYQSRVLWAIFRKTYGWAKKEDWVSNSQIIEMTGLKKGHVSRAKKQLVERNILVTNLGNKIGFNKDYSQWLELPELVTVTKRGTKVTRLGTELPNEEPKLPNEGDTKETIQKTLYTKDTIQKIDPTPAETAKKFFGGDDEPYRSALLSAGCPNETITDEFDKFRSYWTEPNGTGTRVRWQMERTFDLPRRLKTWLRNYPKFNPNQKTYVA